VLLASFAPAGLSNPAAKALDLAIQREQGCICEGWQVNNTLQGDYPVVMEAETRFGGLAKLFAPFR